MAHNSTENLIQSDSSTSTDELNNGSHSQSKEKVSKKVFQKKKTAFVGVNSSVTSPSSSITSSPKQHPIIVVGTVADVHQAVLTPPKPFPRKQMVTPVDSNRKHFPKLDHVVEMSVSGDSESNNSEGKTNTTTNREEIELVEMKTQSESSGDHSDRTEEPKMFFARSRKNTVVTNIDELSTKSSGRTDKSVRSDSRLHEEVKPMPKPRQHIQPQYEIVHEKTPKKQHADIPIKRSISEEFSQSQQSQSIHSISETDSEIDDNEKIESVNDETKRKLESRTNRKDGEKERCLAIYIHFTSELELDYNVQKPIVRCSVVDTSTGKLMLMSESNGRSEKQTSDARNTIEPIVTKGCRLAKSSIFQCQWEQLLMINENISRFMHENIIIFFEILDTPTIDTESFFAKFSKITDEWHYICWAFLKLGDAANSNVDKRSCLQLFRYQRRHLLRKCSMNVYEQFRLNRIKYPATLTVTVKGITPMESKFDLPRENIDGTDRDIAKRCLESQKILTFTDIENVNVVQSNLPRRLPGQTCKYPNMIHKTHLQPSSKGCLVSKFSPTGQFLAYSFSSDYNIQIATVPDLKVINTLRGHTNFVYDLDWYSDKGKNSFPLHLVSASSDRTAVVWTIEKDKISLTILPHPSFLYTAKFLLHLSGDECCLYAVTGGRDCAIRVWKIAEDQNFDLLQESIDHENYITSITCSRKGNNFYSCDWNGFIFEWAGRPNSQSFQVMRKFPQMNASIVSLQLHPKNEKRLYVQLKNHQITCLDVTNEIVLNTIGSIDDDRNVHTKFTISPCGSTVYTIVWDTIFMYNILTGTVQNCLKIPQVKNRQRSYISHLDYHPKSFLLSAAVYDSNGGIVLLSHHSMDGRKETVQENHFDDRWLLLKQNVHSKSSELLGNIIQRIDDILHQPLNRNETDDFKNEHRVGYVEVEPLNISSDSDSGETKSDGTFTIRKRSSISDVSNRTFTLNKTAAGGSNDLKRVNDGTYSIQSGDDSSDDTTISESM